MQKLVVGGRGQAEEIETNGNVAEKGESAEPSDKGILEKMSNSQMSPIQLASIPNDDPSHIGYGFGIWVPSKLPRCQDNLHLPDLESPLPLFFYPHALGNAPLALSWASGRDIHPF